MNETRFEFDGITYDVEGRSRPGVTLAISRDGAALERLTVNLHDLRNRTEALEALKAIDKDVPWWEHLRSLAANVGNGASPNGVEDVSSVPLATCADWPSDAGDEAFHGLAGDIVRTLEPHTESDPHALLTILLVAFGNSVGPEPHFRVGQDEHGLRLNAVLVGPTGHGRKGMSQAEISSLFERADPDVQKRMTTGLSSGEGLIWAVRDPIYKQEPIKEKGHVVGYQEVQVDAGVEDKRLLVIEPEFARTLKVIHRDGNVLSAVIRQAWDSGNLRVMTRNTPAQATGAHISVIGHITRRVVGITPKGPFREAFRSLDGNLLVPPEETSQILLWWRRRGIEPLVQKKTHQDLYKLSRRLGLARRTSADGVTDGPAD